MIHFLTNYPLILLLILAGIVLFIYEKFFHKVPQSEKETPEEYQKRFTAINKKEEKSQVIDDKPSRIESYTEEKLLFNSKKEVIRLVKLKFELDDIKADALVNRVIKEKNLEWGGLKNNIYTRKK